LAFELSKAKWKLGVLLPGSQKLSRYTIGGGDLVALAARLADVRKKAAADGRPIRILSCYEAGLDGHWLHRWLAQQGVINHEIDPSSIEVNRRARRAKTDRIDLEKLMRTFLAYLRGEPRVCSIVHVPTVEDEDRKRRTRERERLIKERTAHINRIRGLLHGQGIRDVQPLARSFIAWLSKLRAAQPGSPEARISQLIELKGIGPVGGQELVNEVFYRAFNNRRQVGSYFGLTGTPYDSGERSREQGISKAGNRRARELAIELAWLWTVHQPDSALTRWF
ncbi:transposase, partial [Bradyrhizobium sp. CNPSo 4010]